MTDSSHFSTRRAEDPLPRFWPQRWNSPWGKKICRSLFALVNGALTTAVLAVLAYWMDSPLVFPSLGPTAFLLFHRPLSRAASPRNAIVGHSLAILFGWLSLALFGLLDISPDLKVGLTGARIGAAAFSIGLTSGLMVLLSVPHPPAGATTLIIALGLINEPRHFPLLMLGVSLLLVQGFFINRAAGLPYPVWQPVSPEVQARYPSFS